MPFEPAKRDREGARTVPQEGPDSTDSVNVGGGTGAGGEDLEGVLAVGKDSDVVKAVNGKALEESLEAEADSVDLAEVVGTGTESSAEVDAEGRVAVGKEDNCARASWPGVWGGGSVGVANHSPGI